MSFFDLADQVIDLLRRRRRLSYRSIKREFDLDDASLEDLKYELIEVQGLAADEGGVMLVLRDETHAQAPPGRVPAPAATSERKPIDQDAEAERRQLSVLFCDVVGSTALSSVLDPEELREVLRAYQTMCAGVIERYGGVIARQVGDGLLVNFGYPQAHEDDPGRAARAGLATVAALPALNERLAREVPALRARRLEVRIGVHTGLAVVGVLGDSTYRDPMAVVGETPNIAARLQALAAPDTVVVSGATHRLLGDRFVCEELGTQDLKGIAAPVTAYRVLREREAAEPFGPAPVSRQVPLVGRDQETGVLLDRWEQTREGRGQVVLLVGEAGIGKSRLVRELKARAAGDAHWQLEGRGSPYHQQSAFYPIIDLLQRALAFDKGDSPAAKLAKLTAAAARYSMPAAETVPFLATLLGLSSGVPEAAATAPQRLRQRTLDALRMPVLHPVAERPMLMIIEDLHWVDPSTLELLELFKEQAPGIRLMLVLTARPDFRLAWRSQAHVARLTLTRLRPQQIDTLVMAVTEGRALPREVMRQVVEKTDGVPLFVEELTKMVLESDWVRESAGSYELAGPLSPLAIPATLQDSLMARLDRLATTKTVVQLGATIGRSFSYELLQEVTGLDGATLTLELGKLVGAELLHQRGLPPDATYSFKHALIQDTAYQMLLKSTRQQYHRRIARILEAKPRDGTMFQPELLAHHYTEAGLGAQALPYWLQAGHGAYQRSANLEAIAHLTRGIQLLDALPPGRERIERELDLQTTLAPALMATKGHAAPEVEAAYARARELCMQAGESPRLVRVLLGLAMGAFIRGEILTARDLYAHCLPLAERLNDRAWVRQAHLGLGTNLFHLGEFTAARVHLERAIADSDQPPSRPVLPALADCHVVSLCYLGMALWQLGYPDQALARTSQALTLSQSLAHSYTQTMAVGLVAWFHQMRRDTRGAQDFAERCVGISREEGFSMWVSHGQIIRGWALTLHGQGAEGISELRAGFDARLRMGAELAKSNTLILLAEAYGRDGRLDEGLPLLDQACAALEKTPERWSEAEIHRVKGVLHLMRSTEEHQAAEVSLLHALEVTRSQRAKSWELRVATTLSGLWQRQGRREAARQLLGEVHGWFTEGFETPDHMEARAALTALA